MTSEAATPEASGTPAQTCARCGHQAGGCPRCGRNDDLLAGRIGHKDLCHLDSTHEPTCYTRTSWELSDHRDGYIVALDEYLNRRGV